HGETSWCGGCG
ncbi:host specificity protein J, partial [Escherichia coli NE037]